jgi:hypothetical protein
MKRMTLVVLAAVGMGAVAGSVVGAGQENQPGMPTIARMFILNRGAGEAVPVVLQPGGSAVPVTFAGAPAVTIASSAIVPVRTTRGAWEYRQLALTPGQDYLTGLNAAGVEGWDAVGIVSEAPGRNTLLLKRPR